MTSSPTDASNDHDDIDLVDVPRPWSHDGEGYPPEAGLEDPDRLPESDGMAEDFPETAPEEKSAFQLRDIGSHLEELRKRVLVCLAVFIPFFALGLILYRTLWDIVIHPLNRAAPHLARFQALGPSDGLIMAMQIALAFAFFLSLPLWLVQAWSFISPGLTGRERKWLYLSLGSGAALFAVGAAAAYFVGIPFALDFLLPFNQSLSGWENAFTGTGYVAFVVGCCAGFGLAFELPLVMLVMAFFGLLTPEFLRKWWRAVVFAIFVVAAVFTPPDPITQLLLALPLLLLFLLGYMLVKWVHREKK